MAETAEQMALPTRIMEALEATVMISQPAVMGMVMLIMVLLRPQMEHSGEESGALTIATSGTMVPAHANEILCKVQGTDTVIFAK